MSKNVKKNNAGARKAEIIREGVACINFPENHLKMIFEKFNGYDPPKCDEKIYFFSYSESGPGTSTNEISCADIRGEKIWTAESIWN